GSSVWPSCRPRWPAPGRSPPASCRTVPLRRRGRSPVGTGSLGVWSWWFPESMVQQEFLGIQQGPQHVFQAALRRLAFLHVLQTRLAFLVCRQPAQRPEVQFYDSFALLGNVLDHLRDSSFWRCDLLLHRRMIREVQRLHDGRLDVALAVALTVRCP